MRVWSRSDEAGSVLVWVLVMSVFSLGALGAVSMLVPSGTRLTTDESDTTLAVVSAESGVNYTVHRLRQVGVQDLVENWDGEGALTGEFEVKSDEEYVYVLAEYGNAVRRLRAKIIWSAPGHLTGIETGIFAVAGPGAGHPAIYLAGSSAIHGSAGTNATAAGSIQLDGNPRIHGDVMVGPSGDEDTLDIPHWIPLGGAVVPLPEEKVFPLPTFPTFPDDLPWRGTLTTNWGTATPYITSSGWYEEINVYGNHDLFQLQGGDMHVRVKRLNTYGGSALGVKGEGRLFLYVEEAINLSGPSTNAGGTPTQVALFYDGSAPLALGGNHSFTGIIYARDANVTLQGSAHLRGSVLTGGSSLIIRGGAKVTDGIVYAPNGQVAIEGGAHTGSIVGKTLRLTGGVSATHKHVDLTEFPFSFAVGDGEARMIGLEDWELYWEDDES